MERKLAAILSADVQGYSRLMEDDEAAAIRTLTAYRDLIGALIDQHHGRVVDSPGDNLLAEFGSAVDAVEDAIEIQEVLEVENQGLVANRRMRYRIGINVGDVVVEGDRIYGDGVNIAARLESLAEGGGISISGTVYDQVLNKLKLDCNYQGEQTVKNIAHPVRVYQIAVGTDNLSVEPKPGPLAMSIESAALPLPDKPSIAVLPFTNMSNDPEQEYFSDGITEDLITDLSQISALFIIARNSVFTYKSQAVKVQQVQQELGVRYVLEGSIRKSGNRVRITAQLVDAGTGGHVWAERFDRQLDDIFAVQDEVTKKIVSALEIKLTKKEAAQLTGSATSNIEAYDYYLRGIEKFRLKSRDGNNQARRLFEKAIVCDPHYAAAFAYLSRTYVTDWAHGWSEDPQTLVQALETGQTAVKLSESLPLAHVALGFAHLWHLQHEQAIEEGRHAIALNSNDAEGFAASANIFLYAGEPQEAISLIENAQRLDPHYPLAYLFDLGRAYFHLERREEAIATFTRVITRNPNHPSASGYLAWISWENGQEAQARIHMANMRRLSPGIGSEHALKMPYKDPRTSERLALAFNKSGMDE